MGVPCEHGYLSLSSEWETNTSNESSSSPGEPQGFGLSFGNKVVWIVLYTVAVLLSVFCNVAVLGVFLRGRRNKTDLRPFLLSLACSDLQMGLFCIPFTSTYTLMQFNWIFPQPVCKTVLFMQYSAVTSSVFTNIAIGVDRLLAVTFPLKSRLAGARAKVALTVIWTCAFGLSSVQLHVGDKFYDSASNSWRCEEKLQNWPEPHATYDAVYMWFVFSITYAIPLSVLTITYSVLGFKLWHRIAPGNANAQRDSRQVRATIKVVKMLAAIVTCFGLNWLPIYLFFILQKADTHVSQFFAQHPIVTLNTYNCCHWLAMSNSFCNFWIYVFMNEAFRVDFFSLVCRQDKNGCSSQWVSTGYRGSVSSAPPTERFTTHLGSSLDIRSRRMTSGDVSLCAYSRLLPGESRRNCTGAHRRLSDISMLSESRKPFSSLMLASALHEANGTSIQSVDCVQ